MTRMAIVVVLALCSCRYDGGGSDADGDADGDWDGDGDGDGGFDPGRAYVAGDPCDSTFDDLVCGCDGEGWEAAVLLLCWGGVLELDTGCAEVLGAPRVTCEREAVLDDHGEVMGYLANCRAQATDSLCLAGGE